MGLSAFIRKLSVFGIVFLICVPGYSIDRFAQVSPGIYRGARPGKSGVQLLKGMGIKTIVDLENVDAAVQQEKGWATTAGISFYSIPLSGFWAPKDIDTERVLDLLSDSRNQPLFIHCLHGEDRTGLMVGLHRVFNEGIKASVAYKEMLARGFHPLLFPLANYFKQKTGY